MALLAKTIGCAHTAAGAPSGNTNVVQRANWLGWTSTGAPDGLANTKPPAPPVTCPTQPPSPSAPPCAAAATAGSPVMQSVSRPDSAFTASVLDTYKST
jgi:hypothetical protein